MQSWWDLISSPPPVSLLFKMKVVAGLYMSGKSKCKLKYEDNHPFRGWGFFLKDFGSEVGFGLWAFWGLGERRFVLFEGGWLVGRGG